MIKLLKSEFIGTCEVKDFNFNRIEFSDKAYIYAVSDGYNKYYEVFERKTVNLCLDFENKVYSETDSKEIYPKSNDFGKWAWTYKNYEDALNKFQLISTKT